MTAATETLPLAKQRIRNLTPWTLPLAHRPHAQSVAAIVIASLEPLQRQV